MSASSSSSAPERTRAALQAKKAQGHQLGTPNLTPAISEQGRTIQQANARQHPANVQAAELIRLCRREGLAYQAIADRLNAMGFRTRRGKRFAPMSAQRLDRGYLNGTPPLGQKPRSHGAPPTVCSWWATTGWRYGCNDKQPG